jgi:hypothetical protein
MRYNGFGVTFGMLIIINILIRQLMINIVAIYMHYNYHNAKIIEGKDRLEKARIQKEKIS